MEKEIKFLFQFNKNNQQDLFVRGIIPELNVRFVFAQLKEALKEIRQLQELSIQAQALLGEVIMGAFLLTSREIKEFHEQIGIQIHSDGVIKRIIAFANSYGGVRGIISPPDAEWEGELHQGKGEGILQVNKFKMTSKKIYSSAVEMRKVPFSKNIEEYISKSDQVNAFVGIFSLYDKYQPQKPVEIFGYFFEALPDTSFDQIDALANFIQKTDFPTFFQTLFYEHQTNQKRTFHQQYRVEILQTGNLFFYCDCSLEKIEEVIFTLGKDEIHAILKEEGKVEITCEFCKKKYTFNENDIQKLFMKKNNL
ncbi:MAG: Hsp33 family molecular chaperone HslO [Leptospiraceae bacterium]|nr:Hsp33 family molecular chaperone HslO [Leptospiraceae bacterium]MDW7976738.1 Hsp33 family molecular chaperone HslO [Leptospiraceae bacterium]